MTPDPKTEALKPEPKPSKPILSDADAVKFLSDTLRFYSDPSNFHVTVWEDETKDGKCWLEPASEHSLQEEKDGSSEFGLRALDALEKFAPATDTPDRINQDYAQKRIAELEAGASEMRDALERMVRLYESEYDCEVFHRPEWLRAALASTAGTDFAERLRKAVGDRVKAESLVAEWKGNFSFISNSLEARNKDALALEEQLAAVTAERDEARAEVAAKQKTIKQACEDWADDDTRVKAIAAKFGIKECHENHDAFKGVIEIAEEMAAKLTAAESDRDALAKALIRLRDCDWVISLPDRMDAVREIASNALKGIE